jgi:hypothetical protein
MAAHPYDAPRPRLAPVIDVRFATGADFLPPNPDFHPNSCQRQTVEAYLATGRHAARCVVNKGGHDDQCCGIAFGPHTRCGLHRSLLG